MTHMHGTPDEGLKRAYHTPNVQEFGSVSQTTADWEGYSDSFIPPWLEDPQQIPGGGGGLS
jgi:hypothetical protein